MYFVVSCLSSIEKGLSGSLNESLSKDLIKAKGVLAMGEDLGVAGPMDPHLLLLAWKMRSKKFFEFIDSEWFVLWANEKVCSLLEIYVFCTKLATFNSLI